MAIYSIEWGQRHVRISHFLHRKTPPQSLVRLREAEGQVKLKETSRCKAGRSEKKKQFVTA
jgi:hypothetical protein